jgi:hypothetical protein
MESETSAKNSTNPTTSFFLLGTSLPSLVLGKLTPERNKTEICREGPVLAFSAGAHTVILLEREDVGTSLLLCPVKIFSKVK